MRDSEVVAAIVDGDSAGLAEAYDRYAAPLYSYCRSMLREPADAADAVQDTFVIAAGKLAGLRDRNRLRPWLYAVARNECHRRLRASESTSGLDAAPDMTDESADVSGSAEREELRTLVRAAIRGLGPNEQELIELQLRQGLEVGEVASVLGVSRNHAHALLSRARDRLETSLGALLVARAGRADCTALDALLEGWDGQLTVLMRKRINRHVENCPVCVERKRRELAPAMLLGLGPLIALPFAAADPGIIHPGTAPAGTAAPPAGTATPPAGTAAPSPGSATPPAGTTTPAGTTPAQAAHAAAAHAATHPIPSAAGVTGLPPGFREQVLRMAGGTSPEAMAHRATVAHRAGSFSRHGFPSPANSPKFRSRHARQAQAAVAAAAVIAAAVMIGLTITSGSGSQGPAQAAGPSAAASGTAGIGGATGPGGSGPSGSVPGRTGPSGSAPGGIGPAGSGPGGAPQPTVVPVVTLSPSPGTSPTPVPGTSPTPTTGSSTPGSTPPSTTPPSTEPPPTHPSTPPPSHTPTPPPSHTPTPPPTTTSPAPPPPKPGTLSVSPTSVLLTLQGASLTLNASGGPVTWSISESGSLIGKVSVSPSSGTLAAGQSQRVAITVTSLLTVASDLTVNPGGINVSILLGIGL